MTDPKAYHTVTNRAGSTFLVRIVRKGQAYGRSLSLTHTRIDPLIEFYDVDYNHAQDEDGRFLGQFVARYSLSTLTRPGRPQTGLNLCGDVPKWWIDRAAFKSTISFAAHQNAAA